MTTAFDRRHFIGGVGALAALGVGSALAGCAPTQPQTAALSETGDGEPPVSVDEEMECDIAIIGSGASGLAACVEAGDLGLSTLCIESQSSTGGNIRFVEGCFAVDSSMQKAENIEVSAGMLVGQEMYQGQYRVSGVGYNDMVHRSGENLDWLVEHGVLFGQVDTDLGTERVFHRFQTGNGAESYVPQMTEAAEKAGVQFLFDTHADRLVQDADGSVTGVIATRGDGTVVQVNARAVVIATGSYMNNEQYMLDLGLEPENMDYIGLPGHDGAGHDMAVACGARSFRGSSAPLGAMKVPGLPGKFDDGKFFYIGFKTPYSIWANENGERFVAEDCAATNFCLMQMPCLENKSTYVLLDEALMETFISSNASANIDAAKAAQTGKDPVQAARDELADGIAQGVIFKGNTLADVATQAGMRAEILEQTVQGYNECAASKIDNDFGKAADNLIPFGEGPYYAVKLVNEILAVCGSLKTDRNFNVVNTEGAPIEGLYAVGIEGSMLWANVYTINISGACNANSVNSGRVAVQHAVKTRIS